MEPRHPFRTLLAGTALLLGSLLLVSIPVIPAALAMILFWIAGVVGGFGLTVWAFLIWSRDYSITAAVWMIAGSLGLFIVAVVAHNIFYALTGVEEPFFFALALWLAPCLLIAAIIRLAKPKQYGSPMGPLQPR